jgi:hypothetical protein
MKKYLLFKKRMFESIEKFEERLNEECRKGYRPVSMATEPSSTLIVLLEKLN